MTKYVRMNAIMDWALSCGSALAMRGICVGENDPPPKVYETILLGDHYINAICDIEEGKQDLLNRGDYKHFFRQCEIIAAVKDIVLIHKAYETQLEECDKILEETYPAKDKLVGSLVELWNLMLDKICESISEVKLPDGHILYMDGTTDQDRKKVRCVYPAEYHLNNDGSYTVTFPDLDGCICEGKSLDKALKNAVDSLCAWLNHVWDEDGKVPKPTNILTLPKLEDPNSFYQLVTGTIYLKGV